MTRLAVAATLGIAVALAAVSFAAAQAGPDVQISQLDCIGQDGGPEIVVLTNSGDAAQDLSGWELRSDPEASEVFDLRDLGTDLAPGVSNTIQSGPSDSGAFIWTTDEVFRDNDPTDYARIVDNTGAVVQQVNCAAEPPPTPTPEPSPAAEVPDGGGPPPPAAGALSPTMMLLLGGSMAAAGLGAIALPRLHLRTSPAAAPALPRRRAASRRGRGSLGGKPGLSALCLAAVAVTAVMVFRFLRRH